MSQALLAKSEVQKNTWYVGCIHAAMGQLVLSLEGQVKDVLQLKIFRLI